MKRLASLIVVLTALGWVSAAHGAGPKLYRLALSGRDTADVTRSQAIPPVQEVVPHEHRNLACRFVPWAPRTLISRFVMNPGMSGTYTLHYNRAHRAGGSACPAPS